VIYNDGISIPQLALEVRALCGAWLPAH